MPDTTAKIRAKGCDATGITEELAEKLFAHKGKHLMAVVELKVDEIHDKTDGKQRVDLVITQVEPADDSTPEGKMLDDHLRELTRTTYYNRAVNDHGGQLALPDSDGPNPKIEDVVGRGQALMVSEEQLAELEAQEQAEGGDEPDDSDGPSYDDQNDDRDDERDVEDTDLPTGPDGGDTDTETGSNVVDMAGRTVGFSDTQVTDPHTYVDTASSLCAVCQHPAGHNLHQAG